MFSVCFNNTTHFTKTYVLRFELTVGSRCKSRKICRVKYRPLKKSIFSLRNGKFDNRSDHEGHVSRCSHKRRKWYAGVCPTLVWSLRVELIYDSVRKYASTRAAGVRRSQPVIPIPLNRLWKSEETDEPALLAMPYTHIGFVSQYE